MKRLLALFLIAATASAQTLNEVRVQQWNGSNYANRSYVPPAGSANGILAFRGSTGQIQFFLIGSGLTFNSGTNAIDVGSISISNVSGLQSALDGKFPNPTGTTSQYLRGDGTLATFPSIPAAQIQSDWSQANSGSVDFIKNKPVLFSGAYSDLTGKPTLFSGAYADLTGKPTLFDGAFSSLTGKPTTLSGYGITDAYPLIGNPSNFLTTITSGQVTTALGFTPYNATNPSGYITSSALSGYLTSSTAASTYQPLDSDLTAIAALATTSFGRSLLTQSDAASARTTLGVGPALSLTTTGTSGASSYNATTGVLNVPQYANSGGTVTSVSAAQPAAGLTVSPSSITTSGTFTFALANDLAAIEGLSGTNIIPYRSAVDTWGSVTVGTGLLFSTGTLNANYATATPLASGTAAVGISNKLAREDHVHPNPVGLSTLVGSVSLGQTAAIAINAGIREVTVSLTGATVAGRYMAFAKTYQLNGGASTPGRPSGYAIVDTVCNTAGQITVSINAPLLAIGASYTIVVDVYAIGM